MTADVNSDWGLDLYLRLFFPIEFRFFKYIPDSFLRPKFEYVVAKI